MSSSHFYTEALISSLLGRPYPTTTTHVNGALKYRSLVQTFRLVVAEEGASGLYGGLSAHLLRVIPNAVVSTAYMDSSSVGKLKEVGFCTTKVVLLSPIDLAIFITTLRRRGTLLDTPLSALFLLHYLYLYPLFVTAYSYKPDMSRYPTVLFVLDESK